jgi:mRNA interferase MazF
MFGEVFIRQFPFTSGATSKLRPALVLFDLPQDAIICRITSALHAGPLDVPLTDWQAAGLLKPSVARLDRLVTAERTVFVRRLGVLTAGDLETLRLESTDETVIATRNHCPAPRAGMGCRRPRSAEVGDWSVRLRGGPDER